MFTVKLRNCNWFSALCLSIVVLGTTVAEAAVPSESILPKSTMGWFSVAKYEDFDSRFGETQIGQMLDDATMKPFREDFFREIENSSSDLSAKLGFELRDLVGVSKGELSLSLIEQKGRAAAIAIVVDTTGKEAEIVELLAIVEQTLVGNGATKETVAIGNDELTVFRNAAANGSAAGQTVYFQKNGMLCGVDSRAEAEAMLGRFSEEAADSLSTSLSMVPAFQTTLQRCQKEAGDLKPELRWHVDPFGFIFAWRSLNKSPEVRDKDFAKILFENGFDAIKGIGGHVNLLVPPQLELVHRTCVYAPHAPGKESDPLRWNLSMRMLQFANAETLVPETWAPRMCANYTTMSIDVRNAFENIAPIFDAIAGYEDAFDTTMEGYQEDPYGPQVNIRDEFVAHMGNRVSMITDFTMPIGPNSERHIYAIKATDSVALAETLDKIMDNDPDAVRRLFGDVVIWEMVEPDYEMESLELDSPGLAPLGAEPMVEDEAGTAAPNAAICVAEGYLMAASDVNYIRELLTANALSERLINSDDHRHVAEVMEQLAPGPRSGWSFARTDEALRPTYELVRQGKMPESNTTIGRLLNHVLTTQHEEDEGIVRHQRVDGSTLPSFESVRRYFGPAGRVLRSDDDGWFVTGALFGKG